MIPQMPQGPTQQAPGQAPMTGQMGNALPNMLAQQKGSAPPPQVGQLARMPVEQLKQLFFQTMSMDTGLQPLTVLAAIKQASESQKLQQAIQGQQFRDQAAQQPGTVRDDILQSSYAGGGIVALNKGGAVAFSDGKSVFERLPGETEEEYESRRNAFLRGKDQRNLGGASPIPYYLPPPSKERDELNRLPLDLLKAAAAAIGQGWEKFTEGSTIDLQRKRKAEESRAERDQVMGRLMAPYQSTGREKEVVLGPPPSDQTSAPAPAPAPAPAGPRRQSTVAPAPGGIADIGAEIPTPILAMREAAKLREEAIRQAGVTPESVLNARKGIDTLLAEQSGAFEREMQRRSELAERRMREAQERANVPGYRNPETLGAILAGIGGAKNFSQALAGAGVGAGQAVASKNAAIRAAEEKYDLQKGQLFDLERLRGQVRMDQAKLLEARATGDKALQDKTAADLASSKDNLAKAEFDIISKLKQQGLEERKVDILGREAKTRESQAGVAAAAADATKLSAQLNALETQRLEALRKLEADHEKEYGFLYNMERISGGKIPPEMQAQLTSARAVLASKQKRVDDALTPRIAEIRARLLGDVGGPARGAAPSGQNTMTMADVEATARASGKSIEEVKKAAAARGYTIQ